MVSQAHIGAVKLILLNTHLESTGDHSRERMNQLRIGFNRMLNADKSKNVIMGGDLNLRDKEVSSDEQYEMW